VKETAERLMDLAEAHIRNAGYGGFSFRALATEIGITSASVHHHFPTKATMAAAVARRYADRFFALVARRPNEAADDAIAVYRSAFKATLGRDGLMCLFGVLGAEAGALSPEIVDEILSFFRRCVEDLSQRIGGSDAEARAFHVIATLEGGMILARAYQDSEAFDQAVAGLARLARPSARRVYRNVRWAGVRASKSS
jgi:TetR/AcrR family transcriptional repressor of nem operon